MKASVLSVGTELVVGQTLNRNAAWISEKLKGLGMLTALHLAVPDQHQMILSGLDFCLLQSDVILVTGGLGPTTDDFTRDVVAEWSQRPLEFNSEAWTRLQEIIWARQKARGAQSQDPIQELQKKQCFFPQGSVTLDNSAGTAKGFRLEIGEKNLIVLPGPPSEVKAIWTDFLGHWFEDFTKSMDKHLSWIWQTQGLGESHVMQRVEKALEGHPFLPEDVELGYRVYGPRISGISEAHPPSHPRGPSSFVEVKISCYASRRESVEPWIPKIEEALKDIILNPPGETR